MGPFMSSSPKKSCWDDRQLSPFMTLGSGRVWRVSTVDKREGAELPPSLDFSASHKLIFPSFIFRGCWQKGGCHVSHPLLPLFRPFEMFFLAQFCWVFNLQTASEKNGMCICICMCMWYIALWGVNKVQVIAFTSISHISISTETLFLTSSWNSCWLSHKTAYS